MERLHGVPVRLQWRSQGFAKRIVIFAAMLAFVATTIVETSVAALVRSTYGL
jgi:hypothetical protein